MKTRSMKDNFGIKASILFIVNTLIIIALTHPASAVNDNLYVSQESMEGNLRKQLENMTHYSSNNAGYYDLSKIYVKILKVKVVPMYDIPSYFLDDSDLVIIDFEITNNGLDYFVLSDKMFEIQVFDPMMPEDERSKDYLYIEDNYSTIYDDELEVRYDDLLSFEVFEDCDYLHDRIFVNQSKKFTICFDVLRRWNNEVLNLNGPKPHYLTLMDNIKSTSCPNCIKIQLSSELMKPYSVLTKVLETNLLLESPLKQIKAGKSPEDVTCKPGLALMIKTCNGNATCVKPSTATKLSSVGWGTIVKIIP